jgi:hypothetical protein
MMLHCSTWGRRYAERKRRAKLTAAVAGNFDSKVHDNPIQWSVEFSRREGPLH